MPTSWRIFTHALKERLSNASQMFLRCLFVVVLLGWSSVSSPCHCSMGSLSVGASAVPGASGQMLNGPFFPLPFGPPKASTTPCVSSFFPPLPCPLVICKVAVGSTPDNPAAAGRLELSVGGVGLRAGTWGDPPHHPTRKATPCGLQSQHQCWRCHSPSGRCRHSIAGTVRVVFAGPRPLSFLGTLTPPASNWVIQLLSQNLLDRSRKCAWCSCR